MFRDLDLLFCKYRFKILILKVVKVVSFVHWKIQWSAHLTNVGSKAEGK